VELSCNESNTNRKTILADMLPCCEMLQGEIFGKVPRQSMRLPVHQNETKVLSLLIF